VDWRSLKNRGIRDRLESAFNIVEREYGVTRLLDPEGKLMPHTHTHRHYRVKCNAKVKIGGGGQKGKRFVRKSALKTREKKRKKEHQIRDNVGVGRLVVS
jgi:hypothetical protein